MTDLTWPETGRPFGGPKFTTGTSSSVLLGAPPIPAGMAKFHWNPQESAGMGLDSTGIHRNYNIPAGIELDSAGMRY